MLRDNDVTMGQLGMDWIDAAATPVTGSWAIITAVGADAVFTTLTVGSRLKVNGAPVGNLNGKTLPKGQSLYGKFTAITLTSGSVVAYKNNYVA